MAQVCGGSSFDYAWGHAHEAALGVLQKAADSWASGGADALSLDAVTAVLLHIYLSEWSTFGGIRRETQSLQSWIERIGTSKEEIANLRPGATPETVLRVLQDLESELSFAVKQWTVGNPESPSTAHTINAVEHILFVNKLTRRPPNPKLPPTLLGDAPSTG